MEQANVTMSQREELFGEWTLQDSAELETKKEELAREWKKLEQEKREFRFKQDMEKRQQEHERRLFEMKWKVLEGELQKMAEERRQLEQKKAYYYQKLREQEGEETEQDGFGENQGDDVGHETRVANIPHGGIFFKGIGNELALKKRYKDLLKIFHPDNLNGDTYTLQIINREYEGLKKRFSHV